MHGGDFSRFSRARVDERRKMNAGGHGEDSLPIPRMFLSRTTPKTRCSSFSFLLTRKSRSSRAPSGLCAPSSSVRRRDRYSSSLPDQPVRARPARISRNLYRERLQSFHCQDSQSGVPCLVFPCKRQMQIPILAPRSAKIKRKLPAFLPQIRE